MKGEKGEKVGKGGKVGKVGKGRKRNFDSQFFAKSFIFCKKKHIKFSYFDF